MPTTRTNPIYTRGRYFLFWDEKRDGTLRSPYLQIGYYPPGSKQRKTQSTGTADVREAELALDRFFEKRERGITICPTCNRPLEEVAGYPLGDGIADYLLAVEKRPSYGSIKPRLRHVLDYMVESNLEETLCEDVTEEWVDAFREWALRQPIISPKGKKRERSPGTVEGSVVALKAAINHAVKKQNSRTPAQFAARKPSEVSKTPTFRLDVEDIARMFDYCVNPKLSARATPHQRAQFTEDKARLERQSLLRFLQLSVCTWGRPDAVCDFSTAPKRNQWLSKPRIVDLNPLGRKQTRKRRARVPVPEQMGRLIDLCDGYYVGVKSIRTAMRSMIDELGFRQGAGETGTYIIRRSMATIARRPEYLGEEHWVQGEIQLGHKAMTISDVYAIPNPANLGRVLDVNKRIVEQIMRAVPHAFDPVASGFTLGDTSE